MSRIFMTGFESGSWHPEPVTRNETSISTTEKRTGSYALYQSTYHHYVGWSLGGGKAEIYGRFGIYMTDPAPGYDPNGLFHLCDGSDEQVGLYRKTTGEIQVWNTGPGSGTLLGTGSIVLSASTWYCIEFHVVIDNSSGVVQVKVDGVLDIDLSGVDTQKTANAYVNMIYNSRGVGTEGRSVYGYWDDIAINDTSGSKNNSWIGRGGIYGLFPEGAGNTTQWTPSAGANWQCVDERPANDDTDYVQDGTVGHKDTYELEDLVPTEGGITAVQWVARAKLAEAGAGNFQRVLRHDGADYNGSNLACDVSYKYFTEIFDQAPDATDWSIAKVNALEAGIEVS